MRTAPALLAAAAARALPAAACHLGPVADALRLPRRLAAGRVVALTFDDGPHPQGTPAILAALARHGAPATFFAVGEQVERHPALAAEIVAAGHALDVHAHRHRNALRLTRRAFADDLARAVEAIGGATGVAPALHRPPYGIYTAASLRHVRRRGLTPLLWSRWGRDWRRRATGATVSREAADGLVPGDVVLLHDSDAYSASGSWRATAAALPRILEAVARGGLEPVALRPARRTA